MFPAVAVGLATLIAAVVAVAVYRQLTAAGHPILPASWCRTGMATSLPPLLGPALFTRWLFDPIAVGVLALLALLYLVGARRTRRLSGRPWPRRYTAWFGAGLTVAGLATNSSIAVYDMALFSAHMVGHLLLVMVAPVFLCAGRPLELIVAASAPLRRARVERVLRGRVVSLLLCPPVALATYAAVIVGSHLTGLMDTIMAHPWAGQVEHLAYLVVGCQFFTLVVGDAPIRWRLTVPGRWILLAFAMAVDTFTGVTLLFLSRPIQLTPVPGLVVNAATDTETGAAIMWVGGDGIMALVMIGLVIGWLHRPAADRAELGSWVESARRLTFEQHTGAGAVGTLDRDFDDEDANRQRYNEWLAALHHREGTAR
jgi:putative copper resistance protein D